MGAATDAELLARVVRNPGRLCVSPSSTTSDFPHGGTALGEVVDVVLEWDVAYQEIRDPLCGALSKLVRRRIEVPRLAFLLAGPAWDEDVIAAILTQTRAAANLTVKKPAETRLEGSVIPYPVAAWNPILFSPLDPRGKAVYFRRPIGRIRLGSATAFAQDRKAGFPLVFDPTPNSTGVQVSLSPATSYPSSPYWQIARLENLVLT
jgi:hypothetical protein